MTNLLKKNCRMVLTAALVLVASAVAMAQEISRTIVVAQDGSGDFTKVGEALGSVRGDMDNYVKVFIKNGTYREKIVMNVTSQNVIVEGESTEGVVITYDDYSGRNNIRTSTSYTFKVEGNNITFKNLTFENAAGRVGQAVAVFTTGDKIKFVNCRFLGNQDTLYTGGKDARLYFEECYIEGTVDFIFGAATALFERCHIHGKSDAYITAASTSATVPVGYVFHKCKITTAPEVKALYLGRPWRPNASTFYIECELPSSIRPEGWHNWGKADNEKTARYGEYGCTGEGADLSKRVDWSLKLTKDEAEKIKSLATLFDRVSTWNPMD